MIWRILLTESMIFYHGFPPKSSEYIRHASVVCDFGAPMIPQEVYDARHLRTLLLFSEGNFWDVPSKLYSSFRYLRELDMGACGLAALDGSIGDLLCLRYLDVSHTNIKVLPLSIENLRQLQTLKLLGCLNLKAL